MLDSASDWILPIFSFAAAIAYLQRAARLPAAASGAARGAWRDVQRWWNFCGKCAWQRLVQRVGGAAAFARCDESLGALFRRQEPLAPRKGRRFPPAVRQDRWTESRKSPRHQNEQYLRTQHPWRQFEVHNIPCLCFLFDSVGLTRVIICTYL